MDNPFIKLFRSKINTETNFTLTRAALLASGLCSWSCVSLGCFLVNHGLIPKSTNYSTLFQYFNLERGLVIGATLTLLGSVLLYTGFISELKIESTLKFIFPGIIAIALGIQIILFSFFFSILGLAEKK